MYGIVEKGRQIMYHGAYHMKHDEKGNSKMIHDLRFPPEARLATGGRIPVNGPASPKRSEASEARHRRQDSGFTLIEMLIVVAIIAILASIVLIGLGPTQRGGRDARRLVDLRQVQTGLELYFQRNGVYPNTTSWATLTATLTDAGIGVTNVPNDPRPSQSYLYAPNAAQNGYLLGALLEDTNNSSLAADVDGVQSSYVNADCTDPVYCLIF